MSDKALRGNKLTRTRKAWGGAALLGKEGVKWIWKNRKKIKKELFSPEFKKKTQDLLDKYGEKGWIHKKTPKSIKEKKRLLDKFPNLYKDPK